MATLLSAIETQARRHLVESTASFWSSAELVDIINKGIKDLWRDIVDLKQEHYLTVDNTNVSLAASTSTLTGVPTDVHKVYLIEPRDVSNTSTSRNLIFKPLDYNHVVFQGARTANAIDPTNAVIYYAVTGTGTPVAAPTIYVAPQVSSAVNLSFAYVPSLADKTAADNVPIPGEADNAVIAWTVAFARAKERDDRSPDPSWLAIYATEKQHLLESLGLRQYQEAQIVDAMFEEYWSS
jgi:hypothetical protein